MRNRPEMPERVFYYSNADIMEVPENQYIIDTDNTNLTALNTVIEMIESENPINYIIEFKVLDQRGIEKSDLPGIFIVVNPDSLDYISTRPYNPDISARNLSDLF